MVNADVLDEAHILILHTVCNKNKAFQMKMIVRRVLIGVCVFRVEISRGTAAAGLSAGCPYRDQML